MKYKETLKITGLIILSLAIIILLYLIVEQVTDYFSEAGYVRLSIVSNASLAVMIYFLVQWFHKKVNRLYKADYGFSSKEVFKNLFIGIFVAALLVFMILLSTFFAGRGPIDIVSLKEGFAIPLVEFLSANLVIATWEEVYFRGFLVNMLLRKN